MWIKSIFFVYLCVYYVQAGVVLTFQVIQDEITIENDLEEYMIMNSTLTDPGTLEASLDFYVTVLKEIPSDFHVKMTIDRMNDAGKYIEQSFKIDKNYCEYIKTDKILFPLMSKFGNFLSECPIKPGNYYMKNVTLKGYQLPLALPLGNYRSKFRYSLGGKEAVVTWKGKFVKS